MTKPERFKQDPSDQLCVIAPVMGKITETYIRRHVLELLPKRTAALALTRCQPEDKVWSPEGACLTLDDGNSLQGALGLAAQSVSPRLAQSLRRARTGYFWRSQSVRVVMSEYLQVSLLFVDLAKALKVRFFPHAHGYDASAVIQDPAWREQYLRLNSADGIICVSKFMRNALTNIGLRPDLLHVVPCGVEVPAEKLSNVVTDEQIRMIFVGRLTAKKGPIYLLETFRTLCARHDNIHLTIVGDGELWIAAEQFVRASGLSNRVTLMGAVEPQKVQTLFQQSHIYVQHSLTDPRTGDAEGLPVSILEAMANGLPVVATRHSGIPEAICDGREGFLVGEGDVHKMAEMIGLLVANRELRLEMGQRARRRIEREFSWEAEKRALIDILGLPDSS